MLKLGLKIVMGFFVYSVFCVRYGSYRGNQKFYEFVQLERKPLFAGCIIALLESPLFNIMKDYSYMNENKGNPHISTEVIKEYSDDSLRGYADWEYNKGGKTIQEQQRGLILPMLENAIIKHADRLTVVEIGTGNGDVIAYLANKYPQHTFIGVDFSIRTAKEKYSDINNLAFIKGYAMDLLEKENLGGDVIFASSTFCLFTPLELQNYLLFLKKNGFKKIFLNEPSWAGYEQKNTIVKTSKHLEGAVWFHNYSGYLRGAGYPISDFTTFHYNHPRSQRSDITVCLIEAAVFIPIGA